MDNNFQQEKLISQLLDSLNEIKRAEAPPFFYTRLSSKLNKTSDASLLSKIQFFVLRPALLLVSFTVFIFLNIYTLHHIKQETTVTSNSFYNKNDTSFQSFVQEYDLSVSYIYSENTNEE